MKYFTVLAFPMRACCPRLPFKVMAIWSIYLFIGLVLKVLLHGSLFSKNKERKKINTQGVVMWNGVVSVLLNIDSLANVTYKLKCVNYMR